jgi:transcriptional regulator with XRE-family HTH domain
VPLQHNRFRSLREAKGLSQQTLGRLADVAHSTIAKIECGATPSADTLERLALALDATTDYFYGRGFEDVNASVAATHMSFDLFIKNPKISNEMRKRFRRVLSHPDAPKTVSAWCSLAEIIDIVVEPATTTTSTSPPKLALIRERVSPKSKH